MEKIRKFLGAIYTFAHVALGVLGVLCIIFHKSIANVFPYVFGGIVLAIGVLGVSLTLIKMVKSHLKPTAFVYGITLTILGLIFILKAQDENIILYISSAWALVSIAKGSMQIGYAVEQVKEKLKRSAFNFFQATFSITIAILLLLDPAFHSILHHIILLGAELIISCVSEFFGLEEEVSLWRFLDVTKLKKKTKTEEEKEG